MIQRALHEALAAFLLASPGVAAAFPGAAARVHDRPPLDAVQGRPRETPVFPYLRIGRIESRPAHEAECLTARSVTASIEAYSRAAHAREVRALLDAAETALEAAVLAIEGWSLEPIEIVAGDTDLAEDGLTYAGIVTLRIEATRRPDEPAPSYIAGARFDDARASQYAPLLFGD